jgi:hypothetical protein
VSKVPRGQKVQTNGDQRELRYEIAFDAAAYWVLGGFTAEEPGV